MTERNLTLPEEPLEDRRLGRHILHDERSKGFPAPTAPVIVSIKHTSTGLPLDQGNIGSCTANALIGALDTTPDYKGRTLNETNAIHVYEVETKLEGQPYPPNDPGGSGLMVCKAGVQMGLLKGYTHAFGINHALQALVLRPVITGINWMSSFDTPDLTGLVKISPNAYIRGGHEIVAYQIDAPKQLVWFWNSWGKNWGLGGRFCMSWNTWDELLRAQGDVTVPLP